MSADERPQPKRTTGLLGLLVVLAIFGAALAVGIWTARPLKRPPLASQAARSAQDAGVRDAGGPTAALRVRVLDTAGQPIRPVRVSLHSSDDTVVRSVASESDDVRLTGVPHGVYRLAVEAPGRARAAVRIELVADGEETVRLDAGVALLGQIVDERGAPIVAAAVRAVPEERRVDELPWIASSTATGDFRIDALRDEPVRLEIEAAGFEPAVRRAVLPGRTEPARVVLRRAAEVRGEVRGGDGRLVAGADVVLGGSGVWPPRTLQTNADGEFAYDGIVAGVYELRARWRDFVAEPIEGFVVEPGATVVHSLTLRPGIEVRGTARDESGAAIVGAEVEVVEDGLGVAPHLVQTDGSGAFVVTGLRAAAHRVTVSADGFVSRVVGVEVPVATPLALTLARSATIVGRVVDGEGNAVPFATLEVVGVDERGERVALGAATPASGASMASVGELGVTLGAVPPIPIEASTPTSSATAPASVGLRSTVASFEARADGLFELRAVPAGLVQLVVRHPSYATTLSAPMRLRAGESSGPHALVLTRGGTVEGSVVDARGFPVAGVLVELATERDPFPRGQLSRGDGTFEFGAVRGVVTLTAFPSGLPSARVTATVGDDAMAPVVLTLDTEVRRISGRVVDERGFPVASARVVVRAARARSPGAYSTTSAPDGSFDLVGVPEPPLAVTVEHEAFATAAVSRVDRLERGIEVVLRSATSIRGSVVDGRNGAAIARAAIELLARGVVLVRTRTDAAGAFVIARVAEGDYTLSVRHDAHLPAERAVAVRASRVGLEIIDVDPIALVPAGRVLGELVDRLGEPVPSAEVAWVVEDGATVTARSDAAGRFVLGPLPEGRGWVVAQHPGLGEAMTRSPVRVFPGEDTADVRVVYSGRIDLVAERESVSERVGIAVTLEPAGRHVRITAIAPNSSADRAGLRVGDEILRVDEAPVRSPDAAHELWRGAPGTETWLEIRRERRGLRVRVERERYSAP